MTNHFKWLKNAWAREDLFKDAVCLPRLWLILQLVWNLNTCSSLAKRSSSTFPCFWCLCVWSAIGWLNQAQSEEHISQDVFWTCPDSSIPILALEIKYDRQVGLSKELFAPGVGWCLLYHCPKALWTPSTKHTPTHRGDQVTIQPLKLLCVIKPCISAKDSPRETQACVSWQAIFLSRHVEVTEEHTKCSKFRANKVSLLCFFFPYHSLPERENEACTVSATTMNEVNSGLCSSTWKKKKKKLFCLTVETLCSPPLLDLGFFSENVLY